VDLQMLDRELANLEAVDQKGSAMGIETQFIG